MSGDRMATQGSGRAKAILRCSAVMALTAALLSGCGGGRDLSAKKDAGPTPGPSRQFDPNAPSVFGEGGFSVGSLDSTTKRLLGGGDEGQGNLPVNKYLWQGALDTLSFLPLSSTDPFTGVIATDWGSTPDVPGERLKVTAYILSSALSAASLKVAVFREVRNGEGVWVPANVDPDTPRRLEDAILTRARQIRIAEVQGEAAS